MILAHIAPNPDPTPNQVILAHISGKIRKNYIKILVRPYSRYSRYSIKILVRPL